MERLTTNQIQEFTDPLAFSVRRTADFGAKTAADRKIPVTTKDLEASYRLVTGALTRLESVDGNLKILHDFAREGMRGSVSERRRSELYGLIRSLVAGIDEVIEQTRFGNSPLFGGGEAKLAIENGPPLLLDLPDLRTYRDGPGSLSRRVESAEVQLYIDDGDAARNAASGLFGITLEAGRFIPPSEGHVELPDGLYKGEIIYEGADSTVILRTEGGAEISRATNVNLAGNGKEWVNLGEGVRLQIDKLNIFAGFDKYDFETLGPASYRFSLAYERVYTQEPGVAQDAPRTEDTVELFSTLPALATDASVRISEVRLGPPAEGRIPVPAGTYLLEVDYRDDQSTVRLTDLAGNAVASLSGVDLTGTGDVSVDLDVGLRVVVANKGFDGMTGKARAAIQIERSLSTVETFDFRAFAGKIEEAMQIAEDQRTAFTELAAAIEDRHAIKNAVASGISMPRVALVSLGASNVLAGKGSLFAGTSGMEAQMKAVSSTIFQNTNAAFATQTGGPGGPVSMLAMLGNQTQGSGGSLLA